MDAITITIILTSMSIIAALVSWLILIKTIRVRLTEPYLSGEPEKGYILDIHEPSINLRRALRKLYDVIYKYIQTGYWGDWFVLSLPFLLLLILILIIAYLGGR